MIGIGIFRLIYLRFVLLYVFESTEKDKNKVFDRNIKKC